MSSDIESLKLVNLMVPVQQYYRHTRVNSDSRGQYNVIAFLFIEYLLSQELSVLHRTMIYENLECRTPAL